MSSMEVENEIYVPTDRVWVEPKEEGPVKKKRRMNDDDGDPQNRFTCSCGIELNLDRLSSHVLTKTHISNTQWVSEDPGSLDRRMQFNSILQRCYPEVSEHLLPLVGCLDHQPDPTFFACICGKLFNIKDPQMEEYFPEILRRHLGDHPEENFQHLSTNRRQAFNQGLQRLSASYPVLENLILPDYGGRPDVARYRQEEDDDMYWEAEVDDEVRYFKIESRKWAIAAHMNKQEYPQLFESFGNAVIGNWVLRFTGPNDGMGILKISEAPDALCLHIEFDCQYRGEDTRQMHVKKTEDDRLILKFRFVGADTDGTRDPGIGVLEKPDSEGFMRGHLRTAFGSIYFVAARSKEKVKEYVKYHFLPNRPLDDCKADDYYTARTRCDSDFSDEDDYYECNC